MLRIDRMLICLALVMSGNSQIHIAVLKDDQARCLVSLCISIGAAVYGCYLACKGADNANR